jgi:hypothetical protein
MQAHLRRGDKEKSREFAGISAEEWAARVAQDAKDAQCPALMGVSLAYGGRLEEAVAAGDHALSMNPIEKDAWMGPYVVFQVSRIHILAGNHERALDLLEPLLRIPFYLSAAWLRVDPTFDPLRGNPRFEALAGG